LRYVGCGLWTEVCGLRHVDVEGEYSICGLYCQHLTGYEDYDILL